MTHVAIVDIGSNSTRLLIADVERGRVTSELERRSNVTRLGQGVDSDKRLHPDSIDRVYKTLDEYTRLMSEHDAEQRIAVLTSAVRDAANGEEFAATVKDRYGLEPHVLSGDQEAQLTFLGATSERDAEDTTPTLVIDIGGGSTEVVVGQGRAAGFHVSTQAGVVRQTERHIEHDPPQTTELDELAKDVQTSLERAVSEEHRRSVTRAIAVAGTATSLAAIAQRLEPYDVARVHGYVLRKDEIEAMLGRLAAIPLEQRRDTPGLHPDRAPTIVAGATILLQVLTLFSLDRTEVSEHDILRGAALGLAD